MSSTVAVVPNIAEASLRTIVEKTSLFFFGVILPFVNIEAITVQRKKSSMKLVSRGSIF